MHTAADRVERAVEEVLAAGESVPRDLGGTATCTEMTDAIRRRLR
jgi:3-isopropylmalate dehydrogenase